MLVEDLPQCLYANDRSKELLGIDLAKLPYVVDNNEWANSLLRLDQKDLQPIASDEEEVSLDQIILDVEEEHDPAKKNM